MQPLLFVDLGSSRLKWQWWSGVTDAAQLLASGAAAHAAQLPALLLSHLTGTPLPPQIVAISVAAEPIRNQFITAITARFGVEIVWLSSQREALGITNGYDNAAQLGVDRWMALLGAARQTPPPLIIADLGSALTLDALDAHGQHHPGLIAPGLNAIATALTALHPRLRATSADDPLTETRVRHTGAAVMLGQQLMLAGAVAAGARWLRQRLAVGRQPLPLLLCGGDAALIMPLLLPQLSGDEFIVELQGDLIFTGMRQQFSKSAQ
ncbi:MAG: type III pantothenate kinase [Gammaproteobacteria bacterium]|nr:type III pantothenate kinase [Gammaproteobacteria bacterium]